jgi:hypothetical protein
MTTLRKAAAVAAVFGSLLLLPAATEAQDAATPNIPRLISRPVMPALRPALSSLQRSGTVKITIHATIGSNIPLSQKIFCEAALFAFDASFGNEAFPPFVFLTRSGTTGKCTFSIPYTFEVVGPTTPLTVSVAIGTITTVGTVAYSASFAEAIPIPNGTTNLTIILAI